MTNKIRVKLIRSAAGRLRNHKACVSGLGLRKVGQIVEVENTPSVQGMINKIHYLIKVENT